MELHPIDNWIIVIYFVIILGKGFLLVKRNADSADYFLAGRQLGWLVIGFSLFASNISSTTLVGLSGSAYHTGISISNYEWMATVVLVFFAVFFIPYYINSRIYTMPEFLEKRFSPACRYYFSALTIVGNIFIDTAGTLYAGSLVVQFFYPGVDLLTCATVLALAAGLYASAGGLTAVVYTDFIQAIVLLIGSVILTYFALEAVGSWGAVVAQTPPEMLKVIQPLDDPTMPWLGTIIGVPVLGFYFWCTNQFIVQRVLGARDVQHARWGALFGGFLKLPVLFIMVFPGLMARLIYPDLSRPDLVFPTMISDLLPVGIKGLVLAGLLAAIMSSVDSTLNSASTLVTMDFIKKFRPQISDKGLAWIGRGACLVFMVIAVLWVPVVSQSETLFRYLQSALAYLFPPVVAVFVLGLFYRRATSAGALAGLIGGHVVSLSVFLLQNFTDWFPEIHFLILTGIFLLVAVLLMVVVSQFTALPPAEQIDRFTWSRRSVSEATKDLPPVPWWKDYRYQSVALLGLTALLVWAYW